MSITGYAKLAGGAPCIEGMKGDLHKISMPFPLAISVGPDGSPLGSTTSATGVTAIPLDPYQFGPEMTIAMQQSQKYCILGLEMSKQLTSGLDPTLSKGRLALAIITDPAWPLYNTPDYKEVVSQENSVSWSLNSSETGPGNNKLVYANKDMKLNFTQTNIAAASWSKSTEADLRQTYQCALVAGVQGAYTPSVVGNTLSVGFIVCHITVATYGRSPATGIIQDTRLIEKLLEGSVVQAYNGGVCKAPTIIPLSVERCMRTNPSTGMRQALGYMRPRDLVPKGYLQWYYARVFRELLPRVFGKDADYAKIFDDAAGSGEDTDDDGSGTDSDTDDDDDGDRKSSKKCGNVVSPALPPVILSASSPMPLTNGEKVLAAVAPQALNTDSKDVKTKPADTAAQIMSDAQFAQLLARAENAGLLRDRKVLRARSVSPAKNSCAAGSPSAVQKAN